MNRRNILGLLAVAALLAGCTKTEPEAGYQHSPALRSSPGYLDHAQPRLPTIKLWIGDQELDAEVARTSTQIYTGMMHRTNIAENEAMLFVLGQPYRAAFYMKNVRINLGCAYISPDSKILEIHTLHAGEEQPVEAQSDNVAFVVETREGWFERHQVGPGATVQTPYGGLHEVNWAALR